MTQHKATWRIIVILIIGLMITVILDINPLQAQFPPQPPLPLPVVLQVHVNPPVRICPKGKRNTRFNVSLTNTSNSVINVTMIAISNQLNISPTTANLILPPGSTNMTLNVSGFGPLPLTSGQIQITFTAPPLLGSITRSAQVIIIPVERFLRTC